MITDAHVAKLLLSRLSTGQSSFFAGSLMEAFGGDLGHYVCARGAQLHFIEADHSQLYSITSNSAVREHMLSLCEEEKFEIGDKVKYVKGGKVFKGLVKKVDATGRTNEVEWTKEKPAGDFTGKDYAKEDLGRDEDDEKPGV